MKEKEKSPITWLAEFAGPYKTQYIVSVILAALGVAAGLVPYFIMGDMIRNLIADNRDWQLYLRDGLAMAVFWLARVIFHGLSTSCSHKATFHVLANMRKMVCDKLARVPLGKVKDVSSGSLKNIIVERVDSVETTLAHILPEFTTNILAPVVVFIYFLTIDWRMALISLITFPLGMLCYTGMMLNYDENFRNVVKKTKILNDTAVEYINGIEVIKAFGKARNSYEKFQVAAKEGASCYVDWMRGCNVFFCLAMMITPCTAVTVLPLGGYFVMKGSLSVADFVMCIILSMGLIAPLITVMSYSDDIGKLRVVLGEITDVLTWEELDRPKKAETIPARYGVTLKDVKFGYHEKEVLHGINMQMEEGTVNALVGPSGSGKSTIAKLIASLWDAKSGSISIGGVDIRKLPPEIYNQSVAYVSQEVIFPAARGSESPLPGPC